MKRIAFAAALAVSPGAFAQEVSTLPQTDTVRVGVGDIVRDFEKPEDCRDLPELFQACSTTGDLVQLSPGMYATIRPQRNADMIEDSVRVPDVGFAAAIGSAPPNASLYARSRPDRTASVAGPGADCESALGATYCEHSNGMETLQFGSSRFGISRLDGAGFDGGVFTFDGGDAARRGVMMGFGALEPQSRSHGIPNLPGPDDDMMPGFMIVVTP